VVRIAFQSFYRSDRRDAKLELNTLPQIKTANRSGPPGLPSGRAQPFAFDHAGAQAALHHEYCYYYIKLPEVFSLWIL
jgi:hypothetical protein